MRRYILSAAVIAILYGVNRLLLIPATDGVLHHVLAWYAADALAGAMMLCILNGLLIADRKPPVRQFGLATMFLLGCGIFWEVVTPLYLKRSVGDPWDVLACWLGGIAIYVLDRIIEKPSM